MFLLVLFLISLFLTIGVGVLAGMSDVKGMVIPNIYSIIIAGAFVVIYLLFMVVGGKSASGVFSSISSHLLGAFLMFAFTLVLFAFNALGGADSKLGTVYSLWVGIQGLPALLLVMTITGGVLGAAALWLRKNQPVENPPEGSWVARVQAGESKVPYGVAIVMGALFSFYHVGYFSPAVWAGIISGAGH